MKKLLPLVVIIFLIIGLVILKNNLNTKNTVKDNDTIIDSDNKNDENTEERSDTVRIKLSFNNEEAYVLLNNSDSSQDFLSMLPLTLDFEDYNDTEKISYLPREISTTNSPSGYTPQIGDFSYYAPWGNLSIFYKEFRYSNSLIKLGEFESGIEKLENISNDFKMTIEIID